jgi:hypothetical protein
MQLEIIEKLWVYTLMQFVGFNRKIALTMFRRCLQHLLSDKWWLQRRRSNPRVALFWWCSVCWWRHSSWAAANFLPSLPHFFLSSLGNCASLLKLRIVLSFIFCIKFGLFFFIVMYFFYWFFYLILSLKYLDSLNFYIKFSSYYFDCYLFSIFF